MHHDRRCHSVSGSRVGKPTQRYLEYQTEVCKSRVNSEHSAWNRNRTNVLKILSDSHDVTELRQCRGDLDKRLDDIISTTHSDELVKTLREQVSFGRLPPPEPGVFNGDPLLFPSWKTAFEILIERRGIPEIEKIYYLKKYLSGPAKEAVEGYFLLNSEQSFGEAKALLEERYGNPFSIGNSFLDKLESWPKVSIKDGLGLRKFTDFLRQCESTMATVSNLRFLNEERQNRKITSKLPECLVGRWGRKVAQYRENQRSFPPFSYFVRFLSKEADILCDPVTSHPLPSHAVPERKPTSARRVFSSNSNETAQDKYDMKKEKTTSKGEPCLFCKHDHVLDNCQTFLSKPMSERKQFIIDSQLCFGCLRSGHRSRFCQNRLTCRTCSKLHVTALHGDLPAKRNSEETTVKGIAHLSGSNSADKCSMIVPVWVSHVNDPSKEHLTYALLDTQSDTTFVLQDTCDKLNVSGPNVTLLLSTMTDTDQRISSRKVSGLQVRGVNSSLCIPLPSVYTRELIPANKNHIPTPDKVKSWPHLEALSRELEPLQDISVGLLIGYDCSQALTPREVIASANDNEPYGQRTDLGWGVVGIINHAQIDNCDPIGLSHRVMACKVPNELRPLAEVFICQKTKVKEQFTTNDIVRMMEADFSENVQDDSHISFDDKLFLELVQQGIHVQDGHYEMPLPFKNSSPVLPDNKRMALQRLDGLKSRFKRNTQLHRDYVKFMNNIINSGHAEEIPGQEVHKEDGAKWYIPHHGVYHPKKPEKIRVVFDCSARFQNVCLNDCLLKGPDLTNNLVGVLCRFRLEPVAVMCDVEQMFHQFLVNKEHRDYLRFLWWKDGDFSGEIREFRMKVHLFGAVSSPGCANFALKQTVVDHESNVSNDTAHFIRHNFYVDDGLCSVPSLEKAIQLVEESKSVCAMKGLRLHKFTSNSKELMTAIPVDDRSKGVKNLDLLSDDQPMERALGVNWHVESDCFQFQIPTRGDEDQAATRRSILSAVSSIFDPIGFLAPIVLKGKLILQQLCKEDHDWDTPAPPSIQKAWKGWKHDLGSLRSISIPRCEKPENFGKVVSTQLHHFSDGSTTGYGQCSYLRLVDEDQNVYCSFVMGKARVAPVKPVTIPRLELTAAVVSVKVSCFLKRELELENVQEFFWTDSRIVLGYISNDSRRFHVYVANRVQQIRDRTTTDQWQYVSTSQNPADEASRGIKASRLSESRWLRGPDFLWERDIPLPSEEANDYFLSAEDPEVRRAENCRVTHTMNAQKSPCTLLDRLEYFSDWYRAKRAIANCIRMKKGLKKGILSSGPEQSMQVEDMQDAQTLIIRLVQREAFSKEIERLRSLKQSGTFDSKEVQVRNKTVKPISSLYRLDPFLDADGVLRAGGRLKNACISENMKYPVILPKRHHITSLIIRDCHERIHHQGKGFTINEIRSSGYWIIGCSSSVGHYISKCVTCRKLRANVETQKMADVPVDRTAEGPPFTYCAMDCFGPFYIREGRKELKRYGVLFTCMASRAIHIETVNSMTTDSFINALRRFLAIRGPIRQLRCDRGTNFIGARNELHADVSNINQQSVGKFLLENNCDFFEFKVNPPAASHMGGIWERQIRTARNVISALLRELGTQLDDESLRTMMCEASAIVNSRPLTVDTLCDPLSLKPLSPNQILTMKSEVILPPPGQFLKADAYSRKRWRRVQYIANEFWNRWRKEFLQTLQVRKKWNVKKRNMNIDDVVMIRNDNQPRNVWKLARVTKVFPSGDGLVRTVELIVPDASCEKHFTYLTRPVQKLVLVLESDAQ